MKRHLLAIAAAIITLAGAGSAGAQTLPLSGQTQETEQDSTNVQLAPVAAVVAEPVLAPATAPAAPALGPAESFDLFSPSAASFAGKARSGSVTEAPAPGAPSLPLPASPAGASFAPVLLLFGLFASLAFLLFLAGQAASGRLRLRPDVLPQPAFISLLERPG